MEVDIDINKVTNIEAHNEGDGLYTICVSFKNEDFMVYGYDNLKSLMKDYTKLREEFNEEQN